MAGLCMYISIGMAMVQQSRVRALASLAYDLASLGGLNDCIFE